MRLLITTTLMALCLGNPALASGDAAKGEAAFKKCKACHMIVSPSGEVFYKGGRTGPNLYGIVGRQAGTGDFRYSRAMIEVGEMGLVWNEAELALYLPDPRAYLKARGSDGKTKMTFKLSKGAEDVAAYLASIGAE